MEHILLPRVNVPFNYSTSPSGLIEANTVDPFKRAWIYGLSWVVFGILFLVGTSATYFYHAVTDRIRAAIHEENSKTINYLPTPMELRPPSHSSSTDNYFEMMTAHTQQSTDQLFARHAAQQAYRAHEDVELAKLRRKAGYRDDAVGPTTYWSFRPLNILFACFRYVFYQPSFEIELGKHRRFEFPTLTMLSIVSVAAAMSFLIIFCIQPYFWDSMAFGSPPLSIRAGMMAVAMTPWIIALSTKASLVSLLTGIGHERLNRLHRWGGYLCMALSIVHAVPFWVQSARDPNGFATWKTYFNTYGIYIFGTGLAAFAPLAFLCIHSLPILRRKGYELFVILHQPVAIIYVGMLFWHCRNALTSWQFLYATCAIWLIAAVSRFIFKLNWTKFRHFSWLVGDDASVTVLPENAIKVTIPTQTKWKPGQYVYLRMPGVALLENHPFTITSLCSDDLPSEYGHEYKDMILVFRPFGGFTRRLAEMAREKGPGHIYRAFVDGPYGGLKRRLESFDKVILIAGGSGITALVSHLLDLIKRMRDGKAITRSIHVVWAMKRPDTLEWFKEELRICRECAPPETVKCQFFITAAKRLNKGQMHLTNQAQSHISTYFRDHINAAFDGIADKRASYMSKRNSAYIRDEADGDEEREKELRQENEDVISPLPRAHLTGSTVSPATPHPNHLHVRNFSMPGEPAQGSGNDTGATPLLEQRPELPAPIAAPSPSVRPAGRNLALDIQTALQTVGSSSNPSGNRQSQPFFSADADAPTAISETANHFNFGFPSTPTEFQKNLMRFAFLPAAKAANDGWTTEYGRPDLPYMLKDLVNCSEIEGENKRVCVFVCGPPSMRVTVSRTIAEMQRYVLNKGNGLDELFMHTENYAL